MAVKEILCKFFGGHKYTGAFFLYGSWWFRCHGCGKEIKGDYVT